EGQGPHQDQQGGGKGTVAPQVAAGFGVRVRLGHARSSSAWLPMGRNRAWSVIVGGGIAGDVNHAIKQDRAWPVRLFASARRYRALRAVRRAGSTSVSSSVREVRASASDAPRIPPAMAILSRPS